MVDFECPECGERLEIGNRMAGERVRCSACDELVDVPERAERDRDERDIRFPASVMIAGVIWLIFGGMMVLSSLPFLIGIFGVLVLKPEASVPAKVAGCAICLALFLASATCATIFLLIGLKTVRGSQKDTIGGSIASFIFPLMCVFPIGIGNFFGENPQSVFGALVVALGATLIIAGVLALVGRDDYLNWRSRGKRKGRRLTGQIMRRSKARAGMPSPVIVSLAVGIPLLLVVVFVVFLVVLKRGEQGPVVQNLPAEPAAAPPARGQVPPPVQPGKGVAQTKPAQPRPIGEKEGNSGWTVIFRSDDPSIWNTDVHDNANRFARSVASVPPDRVRYLKITETGSKEVVIISINGDKLAATMDGTRYGWEGTNHKDSGAFHLGIFDRQMPTKRGDVCIRVLPWFAGWGFGHLHFDNNKQGYCWAGRTIAKTTFEIAVSPGPLMESESASHLEKAK